MVALFCIFFLSTAFLLNFPKSWFSISNFAKFIKPLKKHVCTKLNRSFIYLCLFQMLNWFVLVPQTSWYMYAWGSRVSHQNDLWKSWMSLVMLQYTWTFVGLFPHFPTLSLGWLWHSGFKVMIQINIDFNELTKWYARNKNTCRPT